MAAGKKPPLHESSSAVKGNSGHSAGSTHLNREGKERGWEIWEIEDGYGQVPGPVGVSRVQDHVGQTAETALHRGGGW